MFSTAILSAMVSALQVEIDGGGGPATLTFYEGTQPPAGGTPSGSVQAEVALADPCGTVDGTTLTLTTPIETMRVGSQDITWARMLRHDGAWLMDLTVGTHITLDSVSGFPGGTITLTAATIGF